jgi:hypothetical protein
LTFFNISEAYVKQLQREAQQNLLSRHHHQQQQQISLLIFSVFNF